MMYTNGQILAAVLNKWLQPAIQGLVANKMSSLPLLAGVENKIRSTGWVSPMWNLGTEVAPLLSGVTEKVVEPMLSGYLKGVPDDAIPQMAHSIVENGIKAGGVSLLEGKVVFEKEDLEELQTLLRYNLPIQDQTAHYEVKTEGPQPQGMDAGEKKSEL